jgi:4-hydroxy-4-methyl-2-oxoglutarate aldolase
MKRTLICIALVLCTLAWALPAGAQVFTFTRDQMIKFTAKNPFDRFDDGRPRVPDDLLEKMKTLSAEEIWGVLQGHRYPNQYEGNWQLLHPGMKMIGRAVTAQFMPARPDVDDIVEGEAKAKGYTKGPQMRIIDQLKPGDVLVVDLFGKVEDGPAFGDNLATAIYALSKTGFVVDGTIRDLEGISPLPMPSYFRGVHPSYLRGCMLTGVNVPIRIGKTTVMPGDVVFGDKEGVFFVPPQFVQEILKAAEETQVHDEWTKNKFMTGKYKATELYPTPDKPELKQEYQEYKKKKLGR